MNWFTRFFSRIFKGPHAEPTPVPSPPLSKPVYPAASIGTDGWLKNAHLCALAGGSTLSDHQFLVIHFTSGATAESSINFWRSPAAKGASAHVIIDRDGTIYQCRAFNRTCGHAGVSRWKGRSGLNSCSIGIELANAGDDAALAKRWTKLPLVKARHKNGGSLKEWEAFPEAQIRACESVASAIVAHFGIKDVIGHDDIAPNRKNDPGPACPMERIRKSCGFTLPIGS